MKFNRVLSLIVLCLMVLPGCSRAAEPAAPAAVDLSTEEAKTLYSIGLQVAANLRQLDLSETDLKAVQAGIVDGVLKREAKDARIIALQKEFEAEEEVAKRDIDQEQSREETNRQDRDRMGISRQGDKVLKDGEPTTGSHAIPQSVE